MTPPVDRRRRVLVAAAAAGVAGMFSIRLGAQDARSGAVQNAAREWLALIDRMDGAASWNAAGAKFKGALSLDEWTGALKQARGPLGEVAARTVDSTRFGTSSAGMPEGDFAVVVFRTSFAAKPIARETVTLEREGDVWRVIGYVIA